MQSTTPLPRVQARMTVGYTLPSTLQPVTEQIGCRQEVAAPHGCLLLTRRGAPAPCPNFKNLFSRHFTFLSFWMFSFTLRPGTWLDAGGDRREDPQGSSHGMWGHIQNQGCPPGPTRAGPVPPSQLNCCPLSRLLSVTAGPHVPVESGLCGRCHWGGLPRADLLGKRGACPPAHRPRRPSPGAAISLQGRDLTTQSETGTGKLPQVWGWKHTTRGTF